MHRPNDSYFAELEQELAALSLAEREAILRELRSHYDDAAADPTADEQILRLGLPFQADQFGRKLKRIHRSAKREAAKHRTMMIIATVIASIAIVLSFVFPWFDGNLLAFILGGTAAVCSILSVVGIWLPKQTIGQWLFWSGSTGLTLIGLPSVISFSSFYLIFGPLLLWTGTRLQRTY